METLFTPWRYAYITADKEPHEECFLCRAGEVPEDPERLVALRTPHHLVVLNRHPYTNGHLMVAPRRHLGDPEAASAEEMEELWPLVLRCRRALVAEYAPDGFNIGLNLGRSAGAGLPDHFHVHVVPRWAGDTNFLSVMASTRLVPEELGETLRRLRRRLASEAEP